MRLLIHLEGGLVQEVFSEQPDVEVLVLDFDDGRCSEDYQRTLGGDALCDRIDATLDPETVRKEFTLSDARIILAALDEQDAKRAQGDTT